jgi:hypothetical protein
LLALDTSFVFKLTLYCTYSILISSRSYLSYQSLHPLILAPAPQLHHSPRPPLPVGQQLRGDDESKVLYPLPLLHLLADHFLGRLARVAIRVVHESSGVAANGAKGGMRTQKKHGLFASLFFFNGVL